MFWQIFVARVYAIELNSPPSLIVDGGANVGLATVDWCCRYPAARILAVEPDAANAEMLRCNTLSYDNVEVRQSAIWGCRERLRFRDSEAESWAFSVEPAGNDGPGVEVLTLDDILEACGGARIGLLKLDVEGAEKEIFSGDTSWLARVDALIVECHDRWYSGCSRVVSSALAAHGFAWREMGEHVFAQRPEV